MQVPVSIESIAFARDLITINNLVIQNPEGSQTPNALTIKSIGIRTNLSKLLGNPVTISILHLDGLFVSIEFYNADNSAGNWITIADNIKRSHAYFFDVKRTTIIEKLLGTNISIELALKGGQAHMLPHIGKLEFDNVSTKKGIPSTELTRVLTQKIIDSIFILNGFNTLFGSEPETEPGTSNGPLFMKYPG